MALKATIHKAQLQLSDMDRHVYGEHSLTVARHPSETDERMMLRILAYALHVPADDLRGRLEFSKGLSDVEEPPLWQLDLTGEVVHWIELGQPDERRLRQAHGRAERVTVISYASSTPVWWSGIQNKLHLLARRIVIAHPRTGKPIDVTAPMPPHMQQSFNLLGLDTSRYDPIVEAPEE